MNAEQEPRPVAPPAPRDERVEETLTDLIDRMDREAFHRVLEQRDLQMVSTNARKR